MQNLKSTMKPFGRSCSFVSGNTLAASTVPSGANIAAGLSFPSLSEPPQSTQTLGTLQLIELLCLIAFISTVTLTLLSYCRCLQWIPGCWYHTQQACLCCQAADTQWFLCFAGQPVQLGHECTGQPGPVAFRLDYLAERNCPGSCFQADAYD